MTMLLGIWAFLYVTLIPGLLLVRLFRLDALFAAAPLAFALSLSLNCGTVIALTAAGAYTRPVMLVLAAVVTAGLLLLPGRWPDFGIARLFALAGRLFPLVRRPRPGGRVRLAPTITAGVGLIALYLFVRFTAEALANFGDVFVGWDSLLSWNPWAQAWAGGGFPYNTYNYPQLVPTTLSIPYVMLGRDDLQLVSASIDRFYLVGMIWALVEHALRRKRLWLLLSVPALVVVLQAANSSLELRATLADVPVAFFGLMIVVVLSAMRRLEQPGDVRRAIWVMAVLVFGVASTKQAGLVIAVATPFLVWFYGVPRLRSWPAAARRSVRRDTVLASLLAAGCAAFWYVRARVLIMQGVNASEIPYVTSEIYGGRSIPGRMIDALAMLWDAPFGPVVFAVFLLAAFSVRSGSWRIPVFAVACLFMALWAAFFSYDGRNATLGMALLALLAGEGLYAVRAPLFRFWRRRRGRSASGMRRADAPTTGSHLRSGRALAILVIAAVCGLVAVLGHVRFTPERLEYMQRRKQRLTIALPAVNAMLVDAVGTVDPSRRSAMTIRSEYYWACMIEDVRGDSACLRLPSVEDAIAAEAGSAGPSMMVVSNATAAQYAVRLNESGYARIGGGSGYQAWLRRD